MGNSKASGWALILALACSPAGYPQRPSLQDMAAVAQQRWSAATCTRPEYEWIGYQNAPVPCGPLDDVYGCQVSGFIVISTDVPPSKIFQVVTHEIGHALARPVEGQRQHVHPRQGILAPNSSQCLDYITQADIDLVCATTDCKCQHPESPSTRN